MRGCCAESILENESETVGHKARGRTLKAEQNAALKTWRWRRGQPIVIPDRRAVSDRAGPQKGAGCGGCYKPGPGVLSLPWVMKQQLLSGL